MGKEKNESITIKERVEVYKKVALNTMDKISILKEEMKKNPPKSVRGKKKALEKLHDLEKMVDRATLLARTAKLYNQREFEEFDRYEEAQETLSEELSDLEEKRYDLSIEIDKLNDKESNAATRRQRIERNRPDGYKVKQNSNDSKEKESIKKQKLKEELERIETKMAEANKKMDINDAIISDINRDINQKCEEELTKMEEAYNQALTIPKPGLFKRIMNWWQERKIRAQEMLTSAIEKTEESEKREKFLKDMESGIPLNEQSAYSAKIIESFTDKRQYEQSQKPQEYEQDETWEYETLQESQEQQEGDQGEIMEI